MLALLAVAQLMVVLDATVIRKPVADRRPARRPVRPQVDVQKAIVAIAHTLMVIIWNVLATESPYTDLGADFYDHAAIPNEKPDA